MMKKYYIILPVIAVSLWFTACSDDAVEEGGSDKDSISLSGIMTRADGDVYPGLHLKAFVAEDPTVTYIQETPISVAAGLYEATPNDITFTNPQYYPLGYNEIVLYAYSGTLNAQNRVRLTSGRALTNDALLSNQGYWAGDSGLSTEGEGTPGSSREPAEILQFRHVMTQLNIIIKVDSTEANFVDPPPATFEFNMGASIPATGFYPITALAPVEGSEAGADVAENISGSYTLSEGIHYVVPTGGDLTTFSFTRLVIDNYTATTADLQNLRIQNVDGVDRDALLVPGYAYDITFLIQRLGVQSIRITKRDWIPVELTSDSVAYDPYILDLDLGLYANEDLAAVQKVVLYTTDGREYVGAVNETGIGFVTLPPTGTVDSVDLYTSLGLLISLQPDDYTFSTTGSSLTVTLSRGGMRLENPTLPPAPDNPYLISTPVQIFNIAEELDASYKMVNDLDVDRLSYSDENPLVPLDIFEGIFDGNGYRIQNLIMRGGGLIQRNEGTLKNLYITSGRINAIEDNVAGAICAVNAGTIVACVNEARIINAPNIVGGICGRNEATGHIIACVNTGDLDQGLTLGGLCGDNQNPAEYTFMACINTSLLTKEDSQTLGGIIGSSVTTPDILILNSFWLVGTAAKVFGGPERPVGNTLDIGISDVAALSPDKLRNDISSRETPADQTVTLLNNALQLSGWGDEYVYVLDQVTTGNVWPVPVKR